MKKIHNDLCIGIDLGTTNSAAATVTARENGEIRTPVIKIDRYTDFAGRNYMTREKRELLPSVVYYPEKEEPMVGDIGLKLKRSQPYAVVTSVKSQMGETALKESSDYIKDKTPEEVEKRILEHMINEIKKQYGEEIINDVVITVPANFGFSRRQATMRAAELAGIAVSRDSNGMYNDDELLLSEPEAVIYDFINQTRNGEINIRLDFNTPKKLLVFDIGGGTLDITLHEIVKDGEEKYKIDAIATNRFSNIAGDKFDNQLCNEIFNRYMYELESASPGMGKTVQKQAEEIKRAIIPYAEELKLEVSNKYTRFESIGKKLSRDQEFECDGLIPNGSVLDVVMTLEEFEDCLEPLLGKRYSYEDYKSCESITDTDNIIFPVLDVLYKAYRKLGEDVRVDGVILNGGMSRLYLIQKRLEDFFGFHPIMVTDPDKSVAQGAAVYHYYLHQQTSIMNKLSFDDASAESDLRQAAARQIAIQSTGDVMPESVYLGLSGGIHREIVAAGQKLPFEHEAIHGFGIKQGQRETHIPIRRKTRSGYETIASGRIYFNEKYAADTNVSVKFSVTKNQLLLFEAWTSKDKEGTQIIEKGRVELNLGALSDEKNAKIKLIAPSGEKIPVMNTISQLKNLCCNDMKRARGNKNASMRKKQESAISERIRIQKNMILGCGNPADFAPHMLREIKNTPNPGYRHILLPLARKLSVYWSDDEKTELAKICYNILRTNRYILGLDSDRANRQVNLEAIMALGVVGTDEQIEIFERYALNPKYRSSLLYAYSASGRNIDWIVSTLADDVDQNKSAKQESMRAIGAAIRHGADISAKQAYYSLGKLIKAIASGTLRSNELVVAVMSIGYCCTKCGPDAAEEADEALSTLYLHYNDDTLKYASRALPIADTLIKREQLNSEDEAYLLSVFDD